MDLLVAQQEDKAVFISAAAGDCEGCSEQMMNRHLESLVSVIKKCEVWIKLCLLQH